MSEFSSEQFTHDLQRGPHQEIFEISLLLSSQNINHEIIAELNELIIRVQEEQFEICEKLVRTYHRENSNWIPIQPYSSNPLKWSWLPLGMLIYPIIIFLFQNSTKVNGYMLAQQGRVDSIMIFSGEWWRVFTALTLHVDLQHFISNIVTGVFLINLLLHRIHWAFCFLWLTLLSGAANYINAYLSFPHRSIGFSTAVFTALGLLVTHQIKLNFETIPKRKSWMPLIGGLFLVALMGSNENTDVMAHLLGFIAGLLGGMVPNRWTGVTKSKMFIGVYMLATPILYGVCWVSAINKFTGG